MKINDKHLRSLAHGLGSADKQGYLLKQGEQSKLLQKKWFVLKGNLLFYFEKPTDREPIGVIILQNCIVQLSDNEEAFAFELDFEGSSSSSYLLVAETQEEMEDWMRTITLANYDFMRLKVKELHQKLDELSAGKNIESPSTGAASISDADVISSLPLGGLARPGAINPASNHSKILQSGQKIDADATPPTLSDVQSRASGHERSFEEMHRDFGKCIQEKLASSVYLPRL